MPESSSAVLENRTFAELAVGDSATLTRTLTSDDIQLFALVSGDTNPAHLDEAFAARTRFQGVIAHGMWSGGLISAVLGTLLPGPGSIYLRQSLNFERPVHVGDTVTTTVTVRSLDPERQRVVLDCRAVNQNGETVISGEAEVLAPGEKIRMAAPPLADVQLRRHDRFAHLLDEARSGGAPVPTAICHPCSAAAISAAVEAAESGLITPILVGPPARIQQAAADAARDIGAFALVPTPHSHASADAAVALVNTGRAQLVMKGSLHTDELMNAVVRRDGGLRTERRVSHIYLMDVPGHPRPLMITDAAVNIAPSLADKADIIRNAIDLAHVIGIAEPRVAILSAVETVNPAIPSTLEAAALCKMAERGQICGGLLDGPLAFDNAISQAAAREKGLSGPVPGLADILLVPDIEAGNMLAKQLTFLGGADAAGVVLGARVPIILTSRADSLRTRLASAALAVLMARAGLGAAPGLPETVS